MSFIPDGISGNWSVETYEVSDDFWYKISMMKTGRGVPKGTYKKLVRSRTIVMSNTPDELRDFVHFKHRAIGNVLINGLGLGCLVKVLLENKEVTKITVIEKSDDVIKLIAPYFNDKRLNIIHADAFEYVPPKGEKYDFVWHDIWDNICGDNTKEMTVLHRKYAKKTNWQDSWAKAQCQAQNRRAKQKYSYY